MMKVELVDSLMRPNNNSTDYEEDSEITVNGARQGKAKTTVLSVVGAFALDRPAKKVKTRLFIIVHKKTGA